MGDFEIMQDISYKYESKVPDMSGYVSYFLEFEDEMDPSLSLKEGRYVVPASFKVHLKLPPTTTPCILFP